MTTRNRGFGWFAVASAVALLLSTLLVTGCDKTLGDKPAAEKRIEENGPKNVPFGDLFDVNGTTVTPKRTMHIGTVTMTPDVPFDIQVMRIDDKPFAEFVGRTAEVTKKGDVYEVKF